MRCPPLGQAEGPEPQARAGASGRATSSVGRPARRGLPLRAPGARFAFSARKRGAGSGLAGSVCMRVPVPRRQRAAGGRGPSLWDPGRASSLRDPPEGRGRWDPQLHGSSPGGLLVWGGCEEASRGCLLRTWMKAAWGQHGAGGRPRAGCPGAVSNLETQSSNLACTVMSK